MSEKLTIASSVVLAKLLEGMLFNTEDDTPKEADIPFNVRYKIQRNLDVLTKDRAYFETERQRLVKVYGSPKDGDSKKISVDPDKIQDFQNDMIKVMSLEVEHNLIKFTPEEVLTIKNAKAQAYEMDLFIATMVEDPDRENELNTPVTEEKTEESVTE